jgi:putative transposase
LVAGIADGRSCRFLAWGTRKAFQCRCILIIVNLVILWTPGSPWENGFIESFNARLRDELLDGEIFYSLNEAKIVIESWRRHYNAVRPHGSLGYKPPAPEVFVPALAARTAPHPPTSYAPAPASRPSMH